MDLLWVLFASVLSVVYLFLITKILGYRQIAQLSPFDYVNGISIGSIAANLATAPEQWAEHLVALTVFGVMTLLCSLLTDRSVRFRRFVAGTPLVLLNHGKLFEKNFRRGKIDLNEFLTMCRCAGYFDLSAIETAILEENGELSVFPKSTERPLTAKDVRLTLPEDTLAAAVVIDGELMRENLKTMGREEKWLREALAKQKYSHWRDVFLAMLTRDGKLTVFPYGGEYDKDLFI